MLTSIRYGIKFSNQRKEVAEKVERLKAKVILISTRGWNLGSNKARPSSKNIAGRSHFRPFNKILQSPTSYSGTSSVCFKIRERIHVCSSFFGRHRRLRLKNKKYKEFLREENPYQPINPHNNYPLD